MNASNVVLIAICFFALNVSGCDFRGVHDISSDPKSSDFSDIRRVWKTKVPMYLKKWESKLYLQIDDRIVDKDVRILRVLPIGTEIQIKCLYEDTRPMPETIIHFVTGNLLTGEYSGQELILDRDMFFYNDLLLQFGREKTRSAPPKVWAVDDSILEK